MKRLSGSRANKVCPLDKSTSKATGMAGSTGAILAGGGDFSASMGTGAGAAPSVNAASAAFAKILLVKFAPTASAAAHRNDQPLVEIRPYRAISSASNPTLIA